MANYSKKIVVANWKMNKTARETSAFFKKLLQKVVFKELSCETAFAVPHISIPSAVKFASLANFQIFGQNCHFESSGAYTGEISAEMLVDSGATGVILGHSERRKYFFESNEIIHKKVESALKTGLRVILCVGENLEERKNGTSREVIGIQLKTAFREISPQFAKNILVAYEPQWAIGSGIAIQTSMIVEICKYMRTILEEILSVAEAKILYGGSVNSENVTRIMNSGVVDGVLIGGSSLDVTEFLKILNLCGEV